MGIQAIKNQYPGINAHLHSILQNEPGDWESFHADHIIQLRQAIELQLPPNYLARGERSLQIRGSGDEDDSVSSRIIPDVTISHSGGFAPGTGPSSKSRTAPTMTLPIPQTFSDPAQDFLTGIVIHEIEASGRVGKPVTRIELLSPANKPPQSYYKHYIFTRYETLRSGLRLVEIDYLHQTRSPILVIPSYPDGEPESYPYSIVVSDPRPSVEEGKTAVYGFNVGDAIPVVDIPLAGEDVLTFDFGAVYNHSFELNRYNSAVVDYALEPERFATYSQPDQERIKALMRMLAEKGPISQ